MGVWIAWDSFAETLELGVEGCSIVCAPGEDSEKDYSLKYISESGGAFRHRRACFHFGFLNPKRFEVQEVVRKP